MFVMWVLRFFCFKLYESPKYLMGRGRDEEAVAVVHKVAEYNGKKSSLRLEQLREVERTAPSFPPSAGDDPEKGTGPRFDTSAKAAALRKLEKFDTGHVRSLFATRKLAWSTSLLIALWGACCFPAFALNLSNSMCYSSHRARLPIVSLSKL